MTAIRRLTDIGELMEWRKEVLRSVFSIEPTHELLGANREYYLRHIHDGIHRAYVAADDGCGDVGCGAICLSDELPSPDNPSGKCAYIMNIYVREQYRNRGTAGSIVTHLVAEARRLGCGKIWLESTSMARPLYRRCGFADMENIMKYED